MRYALLIFILLLAIEPAHGSCAGGHLCASLKDDKVVYELKVGQSFTNMAGLPSGSYLNEDSASYSQEDTVSRIYAGADPIRMSVISASAFYGSWRLSYVYGSGLSLGSPLSFFQDLFYLVSGRWPGSWDESRKASLTLGLDPFLFVKREKVKFVGASASVSSRPVGGEWYSREDYRFISDYEKTLIGFGSAHGYFGVQNKRVRTPRILYLTRDEGDRTLIVGGSDILYGWSDLWMLGAGFDLDWEFGTHTVGTAASFFMGAGDGPVSSLAGKQVSGYTVSRRNDFWESQMDIQVGLSYTKSLCFRILQARFQVEVDASMERSSPSVTLTGDFGIDPPSAVYDNIDFYWSLSASAHLLF